MDHVYVGSGPVSVWINVRVRERSGTLVAEPSYPADIYQVCWTAAHDPVRYPLLSGIDPYDQTVFNHRQAIRLVLELEALAASGSQEQAFQDAVAEVMALADLLAPGPGIPAHRQLAFIGAPG